MNANNAVIFEGATADAHETTLSTVDATADRTINLPNVSGTLPVLAAASTTAITSTPEELNLIDGGTARGTTAVADADGLLHNDGGTMRMTSAATFKTYFQEGISQAYDDFTVGDAAVNITTSAGDITIDAQGDDTDIIFKGTDGGADTTFLTIDGSAAGKATFNDAIVAAGASTFVHAAFSGNITTADNSLLQLGAGNDLRLTHNGTNSQIKNMTGNLEILSDGLINMQDAGSNETFAIFNDNGAVVLYHDNSSKFATTATGATITGTLIQTTDTDTSNTGNVTLDFAANQNFVLTLTGNTTLVNPSTEQVGQSGFIAFIQDGTGGRTITLGTDYETAGAAGLTLSSGASKTDLVPYVVVAANRILLGQPQRDFS